METIFPEDIGFTGMFIIGMRKSPAGNTQRCGVAIVKRTYAIHPGAHTISPASESLPIFMKDLPDNVVRNSDFESDLLDGENNPIDWVPHDCTIAQGADSSHPLDVSGQPYARITQTVEFDEPLGGRTFTFSMSIRSDASATVSGIQLEADGTSPLCQISTTTTAVEKTVSATGVWPASVSATSMLVVLRTAHEYGRHVFYDSVQVEQRNYRTQWNPSEIFRYEHDMAPFKPTPDCIVSGYARTAGLHRLRINGSIQMEQTVVTTAPPEKALFGWESRLATDPEHPSAGSRQADGGDFSSVTAEDPLPVLFQNTYYNGYMRSALQSTALNRYLKSDDTVTIEIPGPTNDYRFSLYGETVSALLQVYSGSGDDSEETWQTIAVPMNIDTLVIEPEINRCSLVWRGVWNFTDYAEQNYRRLTVGVNN